MLTCSENGQASIASIYFFVAEQERTFKDGWEPFNEIFVCLTANGYLPWKGDDRFHASGL